MLLQRVVFRPLVMAACSTSADFDPIPARAGHPHILGRGKRANLVHNNIVYDCSSTKSSCTTRSVVLTAPSSRCSRVEADVPVRQARSRRGFPT